MHADLEDVKEEMKFIQAESVSIAIVHELPISESPPPFFLHESSSQKRLLTSRSPELAKARGSRGPFRSSKIFKRKQYSDSPIKICLIKKVLKKSGRQRMQLVSP
ncbi:MAG TPA: hypothetical protein DD706_02535 [Nitrospiraceae bacterium]|nr:hypothetical protein [Nitrospiraceae bacterium]